MFVESQEVWAVLLHPSPSGLRSKWNVSLRWPGSPREHYLARQGAEVATLPLPLGSGLLGFD